MFRDKKIKTKIAIIILWSSMLLGLLNQLVCNEKPLAAKIEGVWSFPAIREFGHDIGLASGSLSINNDFTNAEVKIYPPVRYSFDFVDRNNASLKPPLSPGIYGMHILGTDRLGRDVFAGILRGFYIALKVGLISILFASMIGLFIGMNMGYYHDNGIKLNIIQLIHIIAGLFFITFYFIYIQGFLLKSVFILLTGLLVYAGVFGFGKIKLSKFAIPLDFILLKVIEVFKSIPTLVILLAVLPLFKTRSVSNIIIIVILLGWKTFARYARAETMAIKNESYVTNAISQGQKTRQILFRQILPNILPTILVIASFSIASVIVLESTLSFLGVGLPIEEVSWGSLMSQGRSSVTSWWLSLFPGLCIFVVVLCINELVDRTIKIDD